MKLYFLLLTFLISTSIFSQDEDTVTMIDFVEILNNNADEAKFYYQNNWKQLRIEAVKKGYIKSYQLLEVPYDKAHPFHLMLITTYKNKTQFEQSEANFKILIEASGGLKLLNNKTPKEFRKVIFHKDHIKHL